jgi:hypothetical protein
MATIAGQFVAVQDYVNYARVLLQDQVNSPFRYSDGELISGLNLAILESRRLRPDLWINVATLPAYTTPSDSTPVSTAIDPMYQMAFCYYIVAVASMKDEEYAEDARANVFAQRFYSALTSPS